VPARRYALLVAAAVFVVVAVLGWRNLPADQRHLHVGAALAVLLVLAPVTTLLNGLEFAGSARLVGQHASLSMSVRVAVLATAANLLPLPGAVLVRVEAMRRGGAGVKRSTAASGAAALLWGSAAAVLAGAALVVGQPALGLGLLAVGVVAGVAGAAAGAQVARRSHVERAGAEVLRLYAVEVGTVSVGALRLVVIGAGLGGSIGFGQGAGLGLANVAAAAAGVFPGGLGLREALSAALAPILELPAAVGAVAASFDRLLGLPVVVVAALVLARRPTSAAQPPPPPG
jgi:hypothetical protein